MAQMKNTKSENRTAGGPGPGRCCVKMSTAAGGGRLHLAHDPRDEPVTLVGHHDLRVFVEALGQVFALDLRRLQDLPPASGAAATRRSWTMVSSSSSLMATQRGR